MKNLKYMFCAGLAAMPFLASATFADDASSKITELVTGLGVVGGAIVAVGCAIFGIRKVMGLIGR